MKKRDIFLDFTSLLDVTLIIVFFFVIFSHIDSEANKAIVEEKVQNLDAAVENAVVREENAKALEEQLQKEIETVEVSDERRGNNVREIISFNRSGNIKILLDMESNSWEARIIKNGTVIGRITEKDSFGESLIRLLDENEFSTDDTMFCDLVYDGSKPGTNKAYKLVIDGLNRVRKIYNYFYISETDLSTGEQNEKDN